MERTQPLTSLYGPPPPAGGGLTDAAKVRRELAGAAPGEDVTLPPGPAALILTEEEERRPPRPDWTKTGSSSRCRASCPTATGEPGGAQNVSPPLARGDGKRVGVGAGPMASEPREQDAYSSTRTLRPCTPPETQRAKRANADGPELRENHPRPRSCLCPPGRRRGARGPTGRGPPANGAIEGFSAL